MNKKIMIWVGFMILLVFFTNGQLCYQESATVSNQTGIDGNCGLNYTGWVNISSSGMINKTSVTDGNWSTYGYSTVSKDYFFRYYLPSSQEIVHGNIWKIRVGSASTQNIPLINDCIIQANSAGYLDLYTRYSYLWGYTLYCDADNNWQTLRELATTAPLYEDAMIWSDANNLSTFNQSKFTITIPDNIIYSLQINASDLDEDTITFSSNSSKFPISSSGLIIKNTTLKGAYNISIIANDSYNITTDWIKFILSNTAPNITAVIIQPSPASSSDNLSFTNTTVDASNDSITAWSIKWYIDGVQSVANDNKSILNSSYFSGLHDIYVSLAAYDGSLWSDYTNSTVLTLGDSTPPTISNIQVSPSSGYIGAAVTISANISEINEMGAVVVEDSILGVKTNHTMSLSSGTSNNGIYSETFAANTEGIYIFTVFATDGSGNMDGASTSQTFTTILAPTSGGGGGGGSTAVCGLEIKVPSKKVINVVRNPLKQILGKSASDITVYNNQTGEADLFFTVTGNASSRCTLQFPTQKISGESRITNQLLCDASENYVGKVHVAYDTTCNTDIELIVDQGGYLKTLLLNIIKGQGIAGFAIIIGFLMLAILLVYILIKVVGS
jgi:hypothetical protein